MRLRLAVFFCLFSVVPFISFGQTTGTVLFARSGTLQNTRATSVTIQDGPNAAVAVGLEQLIVPSSVLAGSNVSVSRTTSTVTVNVVVPTTTQTIVAAGDGIAVSVDDGTTYTVSNTGLLTTPTLEQLGYTTPTLAGLGYTTPTLQLVTDQGNETARAIGIAGGLVGNDAIISGGFNAIASGGNAIALGGNSLATTEGIAIGGSSSSTGVDSIAIGTLATSLDQNAVSLGLFSLATTNSVAIGNGAGAFGESDIMIGAGSFGSAGASGKIAIGDSSAAFAQNAIALGTGVSNTNPSTFATYGLQSNTLETTATGTLWSSELKENGEHVPNVTEIVAGSGLSRSINGSTVTLTNTGLLTTPTLAQVGYTTPSLQQVTAMGNTSTFAINANNLASSNALWLNPINANPVSPMAGLSWFRGDDSQFFKIRDESQGTPLFYPGKLFSSAAVEGGSRTQILEEGSMIRWLFDDNSWVRGTRTIPYGLFQNTPFRSFEIEMDIRFDVSNDVSDPIIEVQISSLDNTGNPYTWWSSGGITVSNGVQLCRVKATYLLDTPYPGDRVIGTTNVQTPTTHITIVNESFPSYFLWNDNESPTIEVYAGANTDTDGTWSVTRMTIEMLD